jgi:hypothetical protein
MSKIDLVEQTASPATPAASHVAFYAKTDGIYVKDDAGGETNIAIQPAIKSISAGTTRVTNGEITFANSNGVSFGLNGNVMTAGIANVSLYENLDGPAIANSARSDSGAANVSFQRFCVPQALAATRLDYLAHLTVAGSTNCSTTMRVMLYSFTGLTANSMASATAGMTHSSGGNTTQSQAYSGQSGTRWRSISLGTWNLTPGDYGIAFVHSIAGVAGTTGSVTIYGKSNVPILPMPGGVAATGYFKDGIAPATSSPPASIHLTAIDQTNAAALAQPYFRLVGTF